MSEYKYFDVDLTTIVSFYLKNALNQELRWNEYKWFIDPMEKKVIFQRFVDDDE